MSVQAMGRVFQYSELNGLPYYVLLVIANHETEERGAFPSIDTIAWETRSTPRGVQKAINVARRAGELAVQVQGGPRGTNLYRVLTGLNTAPLFTDDDTPNGVHPPERRTTPNDVHPEPSGQPRSPERKEVGGLGSVGASVSSLPTFDHFWSIYPRKVGKPKAREAWKRAIKRADPSAIVAGAKRYRDDPNRDDAYTAHPTTWLNRDGWEDPPLPVPRDPRGLPPTPKPTTAADYERALEARGEA